MPLLIYSPIKQSVMTRNSVTTVSLSFPQITIVILVIITLCTHTKETTDFEKNVDVVGNNSQCLFSNCLSCASLNTSYGQSCELCPLGLNCCQLECLKCVNQITCQSCLTGFTLNQSSNVCYLFTSCQQAACLNCHNNACTFCLSGYTLNPLTYQCIKCSQNCQTCAPSLPPTTTTLTTVCLKCQAPYYLTEGTCSMSCNQIVGVTANCMECIRIFTCTKCYQRYYLNDGICNQCPNGCQLCHLINGKYPVVCTICHEGYYLAGSTCKPCSSSCDNCYGIASNCTSCNAGMFVDGEGECTYCFAAVPLCQTCMTNGTSVACTTCTAKTYLFNNSCLPCSQLCHNCTSYTECISCIAGYFLTNETLICQPCPQNCVSCANSTTCQLCYSNFNLASNGTCISCGPFCIMSTQQQKCQTCYTGYYSNNGNCELCGPNCNSCPVTGPNHCTTCAAGFFKNVYDPSAECMPCPISYCVVCWSNWICKQCTNGYYTSNGFCIQCEVANCYNCIENANGTAPLCLLCSDGYFLNQNGTQCVSCGNKCLICGNGTLCQVCAPNYWPNSSLCSPCLTDCALCTVGTLCEECNVGFYLGLNANSCQRCPTGCFECSAPSQCLACRSGYYLNNTFASNLAVCLACHAPCLMCSSQSICTLCQPGYELSRLATCTSCPQGCLTCFLGSCQDCAEGYALSYLNKTLVCTKCPQNCLICKSLINKKLKETYIRCSQCALNSILLPNESCFTCGSNPQTQGCLTCISSTQCSACFPGFILNNVSSCVNNNFIQVSNNKWNFIGALIGLGCLSMVLIIILLYIKLSTKVSPTSHKKTQLTSSNLL